jgi:hypothetical protein
MIKIYSNSTLYLSKKAIGSLARPIWRAIDSIYSNPVSQHLMEGSSTGKIIDTGLNLFDKTQDEVNIDRLTEGYSFFSPKGSAFAKDLGQEIMNANNPGELSKIAKSLYCQWKKSPPSNYYDKNFESMIEILMNHYIFSNEIRDIIVRGKGTATGGASKEGKRLMDRMKSNMYPWLTGAMNRIESKSFSHMITCS